ncbi:MAG: hypothetical protein AAGF11_02065 [Myxococcota bacterium]
MQRFNATGLLIPLVFAFACDLDPAPVGEDPGSSGGPGNTSTSSATGGGSSGGSGGGSLGGSGGQTSLTSDDGGSMSETGFKLDIGPDPSGTSSGGAGSETNGGPVLDIGNGLSCDPLLQDCFVGEACYPAGEQFECSGPPDTGMSGDPCFAQEDCAPGLYCADDSECHEFCDVNDGAACSDPAQSCDLWFPMGTAPPGLEDLGSCGGAGAPPPSGLDCNPLLQDCPEGEGCYPDAMGFTCDTAGMALAGDACGAGCAVGLLCDAGTCAEICDMSFRLCNDPTLSCVDYFAPGTAPPGLEDMGYCAP